MIKVIYENENFIVINKPAGIIVHPSFEKDKRESVSDWLLKNYPDQNTLLYTSEWINYSSSLLCQNIASIFLVGLPFLVP